MLLILDTCEHLVDACAAFAEAVLRAAPEVTVLATSRQPFDAPGEHAFPVAPLPIEGDAVELFAQRAASAAPGFAVTAANRADVVRLCRRLNGIPLAIELAAVRLRALPLVELANLLDSGFGVLTVTRRGGVARHQTLRTAIEWSHALCTPAEQALWRRLSVFAGSFDLAAAEEVCADAALPTGRGRARAHRPGRQVGGDARRRRRRSGRVGDAGSAAARGASGGANRYRLLDTLREFGGEQLAEAGEQARFLDRLTDRCLAMATDFDERFLAGDQAGRFQRLRAEQLNIATALGHALDDQDDDGGLVAADQVERWRRGCWLAVRLHAYWRIAGLLGEGRHWLDKALRVFPGWSAERAWALAARGRLATFQGDPDNAIADISESIRLAGELGDDRAAARGYLYLNLALTFAGQYEQALAGRAAGGRAAGRLRPPARPGLPAAPTGGVAPARRGRRRGPGVLPARPGDAGGLRPGGRGAVDGRAAQPDLRVCAVPAPGYATTTAPPRSGWRCRRCAISAIRRGSPTALRCSAGWPRGGLSPNGRPCCSGRPTRSGGAPPPG